jgi:hypothetical protein
MELKRLEERMGSVSLVLLAATPCRLEAIPTFAEIRKHHTRHVDCVGPERSEMADHILWEIGGKGWLRLRVARPIKVDRAQLLVLTKSFHQALWRQSIVVQTQKNVRWADVCVEASYQH